MPSDSQATAPGACAGCTTPAICQEEDECWMDHHSLTCRARSGAVEPQQTTGLSADWEAWKAELLTFADAAGWPRAHVEVDAYRAYFDDGYSARDAWDEDMQHAF